MHDIFLSYSSKDRERLTPLVDALEAQGWTVFWDHRAIKVADDWHKVIGTAIQQCTCVIVAWSENSIASTWVREEALIAKDRGVLYPIFLDMVPIPFGFTLLQAANFIEWNGDAKQPEFVELKEQLSIRLDLQPVVNLKTQPKPQFTSKPTPVLTPAPQLNPEQKPESKPKPEKKALVRQPKPQKAAETSTSPEKSSSKVKLLGGLLVLTAVGVGGFQLIPKNIETPDGSIAQTNIVQATPVSESSKVTENTKVVEPKAARPDYEPERVLIPEGSFMMGCDDKKETGCQDDEKKPHKVNIPKFYLAETEVTVAQFRAFVEDKNYKTTAEQQGSCYSLDDKGKWDDVKGNSWKKLGFNQGDDHPVACVSHDDAKAYVAWLSDKTGRVWRLPSEAEWEYAARAGTTTEYSWGSEIGKNNANCWGDMCGDDFQRTSPVASFSANPFGLYDMHGNVWEWVADKWHSNYEKAPVDGSAWMSGDSSNRVLRGGSWGYYPQYLRSAYRNRNTPVNRYSHIGFRPAQDYGK